MCSIFLLSVGVNAQTRSAKLSSLHKTKKSKIERVQNGFSKRQKPVTDGNVDIEWDAFRCFCPDSVELKAVNKNLKLSFLRSVALDINGQ